LFDLDGTLLPMDTEAFVQQYLRALAPHVADLIPPDKLVFWLLEATKQMIRNGEAHRTNEEVFTEHFLQLAGLPKEAIWPHFDRFYDEHFPKLKVYAEPTPLSRRVVEAALNRGYKVAVATNPVFPRAAILERLRWAEVDDLPFDWVTIYEETHFCKPHPEYYREIADRLGVRPEECVMIGNDMQEDMVAQTVGMKTFYLTQFRINRGHPVYQPDQEGSMEELLSSIQEGTGVFADGQDTL
jgi:HAD superfamily hydrolase (TIGR01549 family)